MKKRALSLLLALVLCLSLLPAGALAVEDTTPAEPTADQEAQAAWEASLGGFTMTDANAYTPTEAQNLLTAQDTGHAYDPIPAEEEEDAAPAEYVPGEVLYARQSGGMRLFGADDTDSALAALGVTDSEPVYTSQESAGGVSLMGTEETTWYRASVSGDVEETAAALKDLSGIVDAEPNYLYTTEVVGEPSQTEIQNSWFMSTANDANAMHLRWGWWWRWWPGMPYAPGEYDGDYDQYFEDNYGEDEVPAPGKDVVVAVIDTGVDYTHQDLAASMWVNGGEIAGNGIDDDDDGYVDDVYGIDATANPQFDGAIAGDPMDYNGHGTHVAGIIAMSNNGEGGVGAAYGAKIMAIKAGQATGTFTSADIAEAIQYAHSHGADVINMSFGGSAKSNLVREALEDAFTDCVLVAAAGNNGWPTTDAPDEFVKKVDIYPASYSFVIGVMAADESGKLAGFSNWDYFGNANAEYEVAAPGVNIYSTLPGDRYANWSGTSMATPCVASAAAVLRAAYPDKNEYNSRFIMGQLVSATTQSVTYVDKIDIVHEYAKLDLYDSLTNLPKPNLRMAEVFALDNVRVGTDNDGDRIMDAGETIDLGVAVRNQWGKSGTITVKADAISTGGVANPYVTFLNDTVTLDPAGTFQTVDNGFVWDDSLLADVTSPIRFKLADNTPNDTQIQINLTVTTTNGLDASDTATYTINPHPTFAFRVQRGAAIRGHITTDTTLTADKYWIVENALLVDEGATLTVEPGTQIQFWSSDYEDAYGGKTIVYISNNGTLNMLGTEAGPIELFPGSGFEDYSVFIFGQGFETLSYCNIINPILGVCIDSSKPYDSLYCVDSLNHSRLTQVVERPFYRSVENNIVLTNDFYRMHLGETSYCSFKNLYSIFGIASLQMELSACNLYENCKIGISSSSKDVDCEKSVFLSGEHANHGLYRYGNLGRWYKSIPLTEMVLSDPFTYDGSASKYVLMEPYSFEGERMLAKMVAEQAGGSLLCFDDEADYNDFRTAIHYYYEKYRVEGTTGEIGNNYIYIDFTVDPNTNKWTWGNGSNYIPEQIADRVAYTVNPDDNYRYMYIQAGSRLGEEMVSIWFNVAENVYREDYFYAMEFPATLSDEEITNAINNFDVKEWLADYYPGSVYHSAILNPVLNTNPETWTRFSAPSYNSDYYYPLHGNYWGTENSTLINKMIIDDDDYPGTLADIVETPILTLNDDLSMIYPFVTKIWLTEKNGSTPVEDAAPGVIYDVHVTFNRDMDQTAQPSITYGGEDPFTDYGVTGDWISAREWAGQTKISSVTTGGTMMFRAKGGQAASDHWLVCGTDQQRFQFNINTVSAQSAVLNASGGAGKVTLQWAQNDYELLAGYNLYRSTSADSGFTKLNDTVLTGSSYVDTNVDPGVRYYYYFTIVNTDGDEIDGARSNTVSAAPLDNVAPTVIHSPVTSARQGQALSISCQAQDNIAVTAVTLNYRTGTSGAYQSLSMTYNSATERYTASIPASAVTGAGLQYYIEARDAAGNTGASGSFAVPYTVNVDSSVTLLTVFPNVVTVGALPDTMTVYGTNLDQGMTVKVGTASITDYTVSADGDQITFAAPDLSVGVYPVTVTGNGKTVTLPSAVTYRDEGSYVQLNPGEGAPGVEMKLPLYAVQSGPLYALRAEIEVPESAFSAVDVEAAADFGGQVQTNWQNGVLTVSMVNAGGYTASAAQPVAWVVLTPKAVAGQTTVPLTLKTAKLNDVSVLSAPQIIAVVITPSYSLDAQVQYYKGSAAVPGVLISAAGVSGTTDASGLAQLAGIKAQEVTVTAARSDYDDLAVNLLDVLMLLRSLVGQVTLDQYQQVAADVTNDGAISEMDAVAILRKLVELDDSFASSAWRFVPASQSMELSDSGNSVSFIAVLMGDVDGSWKASS